MKISQSLGAIAMGRSAATLSRDITDEIGFHIEMLREELIAGGMKPEDAKLEAQRRFGDSRKIAQECESIQIGKWIWFTRISLASIGVLLMIVGGLVFLVFKLTLNNKILHERLATESALSHSTNLPVTLPTRLETLESGPLSTEELAAGATVPELAAETLRGIVLKADGKPIENAKVVLVH